MDGYRGWLRFARVRFEKLEFLSENLPEANTNNPDSEIRMHDGKPIFPTKGVEMDQPQISRTALEKGGEHMYMRTESVHTKCFLSKYDSKSLKETCHSHPEHNIRRRCKMRAQNREIQNVSRIYFPYFATI